MTAPALPSLPSGSSQPAKLATNHLGLTLKDYGGAPSTLCNGCGHDAITAALIQAAWEDGLNPYKLAKMSGIGCSSKTTAYFVSKAWGFNAVHGRMPSVATGAALGNHTLQMVGVSGDGDTASIGIGQFVHAIRRNLPMVYVVENNGVYGLTKGQFSATAEKGAKSRWGDENFAEGIDLCGLALELGATFVARSFSADKKQLVPLIRSALNHRGIAVLDVISPCVTFNNHEASTKSYDWGREHEKALHEIGFVNPWDAPDVAYGDGDRIEVPMPDGGRITLRKMSEDHDPRNKDSALRLVNQARRNHEFLTGLFYVNGDQPNFVEGMNLVDEPLATLPASVTRPPKSVLDEVMESFR
ncbi:MAG: 2-oxoacid:ferredoxin oxidoreductase subunit beta [Planctomycetes bacterium]|nr:2-oxoacid:ferredoxin oxidoreductase subunit beta [Planctomycetota bacterium]